MAEIREFTAESLKYYQEQGFQAEQIEQIQKGYMEGLVEEQIKVYANPSLDVEAMAYIRESAGWLSLDKLEMLASEGFSMEQRKEIAKGLYYLENAQKCEVFVRPEFSAPQISAIVEGMRCSLDMEKVEFYANPSFDDIQMKALCQAFRNKLSIEDVEWFAKPEVDAEIISLFQRGIYHGVQSHVLQNALPSEWSSLSIQELTNYVETLENQYSSQYVLLNRERDKREIGDTFPVYTYQYDQGSREVIETPYTAYVKANTVFAPFVDAKEIDFRDENGKLHFPAIYDTTRQPIASLDKTLLYFEPSMDEAHAYFSDCLNLCIEEMQQRQQDLSVALEDLYQQQECFEQFLDEDMGGI